MQSVLLIITPGQDWPIVWTRVLKLCSNYAKIVLKLSLNFEEILSRAEENFEERNKVFESSVNHS